MARLNAPTAEGVAQLLAYSNTVEGQIRQGATNAEIWAEVRNIEAQGGPPVNASIFDMNFVSSQIRGVLAAEANFGAAAPGDGVTGEMWAWAPWADASTASHDNPNYQIRYRFGVVDDGGQQTTIWGQTDWMGPIDGPVSQITDRVLGSAQSALDVGSPGALRQLGNITTPTITGVSAVQILRV